MKIALVTLYHENYEPLARVILPNWAEYCQRHGYGLITHCGHWKHENSQIGFQKIRMIYDDFLVPSGEWDAFLVLDLDILITNFNRKVEEFIDETHDYFVPTGFNGLCNGSFILKNNAGGNEVIATMLTNRYGHNNEQDTMKFHLDEEPFKSRVKLFKYTDFGSFMLDLYPEHRPATRERGNWEKGDFILHLAGLELPQRLEIVRYMLDSDQITK